MKRIKKIIVILLCAVICSVSTLMLGGCAKKCEDCAGRGQVVCNLCSGTGRSVCVFCGGLGSKYEYDFFTGRNELKTCISCIGGRTDCRLCTNGEKSCIACLGSGKVDG